MALYTIILEYADGTYVAQVEAATEMSAFRSWLSDLPTERTADGVSEEIARAFHSEDRLVAAAQLQSLWFATATAPAGFATVNVIKTAT